MKNLSRRPELDAFWDDVQRRASAGVCEGSCEQHSGPIGVFRSISEKTDWGWFAYCQKARDEDKRRGFRTLDYQEWLSHIQGTKP